MIWQVKALIQSILARISHGEAINHALQRRNPVKDDAPRLGDITTSLKNLSQLKPIEGATIVEVGTGWDALPTIWLSSTGARRIITFDHLPHLRLPLACNSARTLAELDPGNPVLGKLMNARSLSDFLNVGGIDYRAPGDAASTSLTDKSVDIFFSYAVLEHVPAAVADRLLKEAKRVLKPDGVFFSVIGLHDHYAGMNGASKVNFLKYPEWFWALLVKNKFSYHNRLREKDFLRMIEANGGTVVDVKSRVDPKDLEQISSMKIDKRFSGYSAHELAVTRTEIAARF